MSPGDLSATSAMFERSQSWRSVSRTLMILTRLSFMRAFQNKKTALRLRANLGELDRRCAITSRLALWRRRSCGHPWDHRVSVIFVWIYIGSNIVRKRTPFGSAAETDHHLGRKAACAPVVDALGGCSHPCGDGLQSDLIDDLLD